MSPVSTVARSYSPLRKIVTRERGHCRLQFRAQRPQLWIPIGRVPEVRAGAAPDIEQVERSAARHQSIERIEDERLDYRDERATTSGI